jgi:simple sugar transport system ATP-binding protein
VGVLSGGERQGLAIARAMYFQADIIILDEPTTALSLAEVDKVLHFVQRIKEENKSCIYISHNVSQLYPAADRFVCLDRGRVATVLEKSDVSLKELADVLISLTGRGREDSSP